MDIKLQLNVKDGETVDEVLGISPQRNEEFIDFAAKLTQRDLFDGDTSVVDCLQKLVDFAQTPEELVYFVYHYSSVSNKIKNQLRENPMEILSQILG